jgi:hypothetical protein
MTTHTTITPDHLRTPQAEAVEIYDDNRQLVGYAAQTNPRNDRWTLTTANGITLVTDAADLTEAANILCDNAERGI